MISWQLPIWLLLLWISLFLIVHIHGITLYVTFCVWHLSRSVMFKGSSMLLDVSVLHSFLCLHNIPWHGYAAICLYIHLFIDVWVVSIALAKSLFPYMILWKNLTIFLANPLPFDQYEYRCTCTCLSTVFKMVLYLTVDLLGQMVILCLTFSGTAEQLCRESWAIYMPTGSVQRVTISPHSHKSLLFCCKKCNVGNFVVNHQEFTSCFRGMMFSHQLFSELSLSYWVKRMSPYTPF